MRVKFYLNKNLSLFFFRHTGFLFKIHCMKIQFAIKYPVSIVGLKKN